MIRYLSAGESHGRALVAIIEGLPSGILLDVDFINKQLAKRQGGYGRGGRMKIETDHVQFLTGVRNGYTIGAPITLMIENKDWENWKDIMSSKPGALIDEKTVTLPRPGHADLSGGIKYRQKDLRNILERASARETAIRVAVGAVAQNVLKQFGIVSWAHVVALGGVMAEVNYSQLNESLYETDLYCTDKIATEKMKEKIDEVKLNGDTLGGVVEVVVQGMPVGLGSHVQYDRKLDGLLAQSVMSIQAFKAVEFGVGQEVATLLGSVAHDEIGYDHISGFYHLTNRCGGVEGGMTNGEDLIIRGTMKPIPTLYQPLKTVELHSKESGLASVERSDACAVPAAAIVMENAVAWTILQCFLEKFSGDHFDETKRNYEEYISYVGQV